MNSIFLPQNTYFHEHAQALTKLVGDAEGFTIFARKDGKKWRQLGALPASQASRIYDIIPRAEMVDMYFTVNTFYRVGPKMENGLNKVYNKFTTKEGVEMTGTRQEKNLQDFRCLYVDMDIYRNKVAVNWRDATALVQKMADKGIIPHPSFFANSGRGAYAIWTIKPHETKPVDLLNYKALNRALYREFLAYSPLLEPDDVFDGSRVLRLPGSVNSKAPDNPVAYVVQYDNAGRHYDYTLEGVAAKLGVTLALPTTAFTLAATTPKKTRKLDPKARLKLSKGGKNGIRSLGIRRLSELKEIIKYKKVTQGFRYKTLFLVASTARIAGVDKSEAITILKDMASGFLPPYPGTDANDVPVDEIVAAAYKGDIIKSKATTLARFFNLSTHDCRHLLLSTIYTEEIEKVKITPKRTSKEKLESAIIELAPSSTCLLDLCHKLFSGHAIPLSKSQASRIVKRLGIKLGQGIFTGMSEAA
jgi:hypothetical protein